MRHVGRAQAFDAFYRPERDINRVMPQEKVNERTRRALPAFDLVLAHAVNEVVLLGRDELSKPFAVDGLAAPLDGSKRSTINVYERRRTLAMRAISRQSPGATPS